MAVAMTGATEKGVRQSYAVIAKYRIDGKWMPRLRIDLSLYMTSSCLSIRADEVLGLLNDTIKALGPSPSNMASMTRTRRKQAGVSSTDLAERYSEHAKKYSALFGS